MIRIAVVDKMINDGGYSIHRIEDNGLVKCIKTTEYQQETIDQLDDDEQIVVVFNININGEEGKALIVQIGKRKAKVCLYLSTEPSTPSTPRNLDGMLASADGAQTYRQLLPFYSLQPP